MRRFILLIVLTLLINVITVFAATNTAGEKYYSKTAGLTGYTAFVIYPQSDANDLRIAYCFDHAKAYPSKSTVDYELKYPDASSDQMIATNSDASKYLEENNISKEYLSNIIANIIYLGASYNGSANNYREEARSSIIASKGYDDPDLTEGFFREATQIALWRVTDNYAFSSDETRTLAEKIYNEAVQNYQMNLARQAGIDLKIDLFYTDSADSSGKNYQTLVSSRVSTISANITASKTLDGIAPADQQFTFELTGNGSTITAKNDAYGNITFNMSYTKAGTYTYTLKETAGSDPEINYDTNTYNVTVTVTLEDTGLKAEVSYDGKIAPVFANTTKPSVTASIKAHKTLDNITPEAGAFTFELTDMDNNKLTAANDENGNITFDMSYTATGTYTYILKEVAGSDASINYDTASYPVTVTVSENADNKLTAEVAYGTGTIEPTFKNIAIKNVVTAHIKANKTFNGAVSTRQFTFGLYDENNNLAGDYVQNGTDGVITFSHDYESSGTYDYTIKEIVDDSDTTTQYDTTAYPVRVVVDPYDFDTFSQTSYYSYQKSEYEYYMNANEPGEWFPVYPIDINAAVPSDSLDKTVNTTQYDVYANPDNETLAKYVGDNVLGDALAEDLRKLMYFFDINPTYKGENSNNAASLTKIATNQISYNSAKAYLESVLANVIVPDNYEFYLFVPKDYDKTDSSRQTPLIGGKGATINYSSYTEDYWRSNYPDMAAPTIENKTIVYLNLKAQKYLDTKLLDIDYSFSFSLYEADSSWNIGDTPLMTANNTGSDISFNNVKGFTIDDIGKTFYYAAKENDDATYDIDKNVKKYTVNVINDNGLPGFTITVGDAGSDIARFDNYTKYVTPTGVESNSPLIYVSLLVGAVCLLLGLKRIQAYK